MVAIYKYENGLRFIGKIANNEKEAWDWLDKTYGKEFSGVWYGASRNTFKIEEVEIVNTKNNSIEK